MTENKVAQKAKDASVDSDKKKLSQNKTAVKKVVPNIYIHSVILLAIFVAGGFFLYKKIQNINQITVSLSRQTTAHREAIDSRIQKLEESIDQLSTQTEVLKNSINDLYQQQPASNEDWALSEAEYLLIIATHRLLLEKDADTAIAAMEAASQRLESLGTPDLMPVREQLVSDINKLKAVNVVDITGLSIYLADLIEKTDKLPIKRSVIADEKAGQTKAAGQSESEAGWKGVMYSIWQELKSLVIIKRRDEVKQELLLPDQEYFLSQNLRLELESARLSALRHDTENFHTSIKLIMDWLNKYYEVNHSGVMNILDTLKQMSTVKLDPDLPDISSSLETLRAYIRNRETAMPIMKGNK